MVISEVGVERRGWRKLGWKMKYRRKRRGLEERKQRRKKRVGIKAERWSKFTMTTGRCGLHACTLQGPLTLPLGLGLMQCHAETDI